MGTTVLKRNSFIPKMHKNLMQVIVFTLAFILTFSALEVMGAPRETREAEGVEGGMTNALKYLEELDKYYSQVARPSFSLARQRRVEQNLSSALERLSAIKNYYSEMGRSRFGKRSGGTMYAKSPVDNMMYYPGYEQLYE